MVDTCVSSSDEMMKSGANLQDNLLDPETAFSHEILDSPLSRTFGCCSVLDFCWIGPKIQSCMVILLLTVWISANQLPARSLRLEIIETRRIGGGRWWWHWVVDSAAAQSSPSLALCGARQTDSRSWRRQGTSELKQPYAYSCIIQLHSSGKG